MTRKIAVKSGIEEISFGNGGGYTGEIKTYQIGSTGIKLELSFGDNAFMEFIEASYFSHQEQTGKEILGALKSIQVKKK